MLSLHKRRYEELERYRKRTNHIKFCEGLLVGTAMGLLAGMILAPKPGKETIEDIKGETKKLVEKGKEMIPCCGEDEDDALPEPDVIEFDMDEE